MRAFLRFSFLSCLLVPTSATAGEVKPLSAWVQVGRGGGAEVRMVTDAQTCPRATVDGRAQAAGVRAAPDDAFAVRVCSTAIPMGARSILAGGVSLTAPVNDPQRILVLGDTGCRITAKVAQACNDAKQWPFPTLAASAAKLRPDLVIDVGDYLYREAPCPQSNTGCSGSPSGDNWPAWAADFFTPAQPLLAAAPWIFVRGNHENCQRSGPGFARLIGPDPFEPVRACDDHFAPYAAALARMSLVVWDDTAAPNTGVNTAMLPAYRNDFTALATIAPKPIWLFMHEPIWAAVTGPFGMAVGGTPTMIEASGDQSALAPVALLLAGHIHAFEAINYAAKVPPQIVAGHGGDELTPTPADLKGTVFQGHSGVTVKDGISVGGFGFLLMTRSEHGWAIDLYKADGSQEGQCAFANGRVDCAK